MKNPRILNISGGATKLSALYGSTEYVCENRDFDIITGVSAGAIIAPFAAIGKFNIDNIIFKVTPDDIFKVKPGFKLRNIIRLIFGKSSGNQSNLKKLLKENFTLEDYNKMKSSGKRVIVGLTNFNARYLDEVFEMHNICMYEYESAIDLIYASACIPFLTEGVERKRAGRNKSEMLYDGGVIAHICSQYMADKYDAKDMISIFSRPDKVKLSEDYCGGRGLESLERLLEIMAMILSKYNERVTDEECEDKNIPHKKIFMPHKLTDELYPVGEELFRGWYQIGRDAAKEELDKQ